MVLLVTYLSSGEECGAAVNRATGERTRVANTVRQAVSLLKGDEYNALVIDESMLESEPAAVDLLLLCAGTAIPVYVNLAISGSERVVREVRVALDRRRREQVIAVQLAESVLHKELNGSLSRMRGRKSSRFATWPRKYGPYWRRLLLLRSLWKAQG